MAEEKNGEGAGVRVTVRISVPDVLLDDVAMLTVRTEEFIADLEGATYDLNISSPRPERPR